MIFNLSQKSLTFIKNGIDNGAINNIDTSKTYTMAIAMRVYDGDNVQLTQFCVHYH